MVQTASSTTTTSSIGASVTAAPPRVLRVLTASMAAESSIAATTIRGRATSAETAEAKVEAETEAEAEVEALHSKANWIIPTPRLFTISFDATRNPASILRRGAHQSTKTPEVAPKPEGTSLHRLHHPPSYRLAAAIETAAAVVATASPAASSAKT